MGWSSDCDQEWDSVLKARRVEAMMTIRLLGKDHTDKDLQEKLKAIGRYVGTLETFLKNLNKTDKSLGRSKDPGLFKWRETLDVGFPYSGNWTAKQVFGLSREKEEREWDV